MEDVDQDTVCASFSTFYSLKTILMNSDLMVVLNNTTF